MSLASPLPLKDPAKNKTKNNQQQQQTTQLTKRQPDYLLTSKHINKQIKKKTNFWLQTSCSIRLASSANSPSHTNTLINYLLQSWPTKTGLLSKLPVTHQHTDQLFATVLTHIDWPPQQTPHHTPTHWSIICYSLDPHRLASSAKSPSHTNTLINYLLQSWPTCQAIVSGLN